MAVHCGAKLLAIWLVWLIAAADAGAVTVQLQTSSCPEKAAPVCGSDGLTYYNECLAKIQDVQVQHAGYCKDAFFSFTKGSSSRTVQEAAPRGSKLSRRIAPKERAVAQLSASVINAYSSEGFVYVGRAKLSHRPGTQQSSSSGSSSSSSHRAIPERAAAGVMPAWVSAVRFTPEGHVYVAKQLDLNQTETAAEQMAQIDIPPQIPPEVKLAAAASSSNGSSSSNSSLQNRGRHLSIMVGADERKICPAGPAYPFTAIGQIDFQESGTDYICSAALITQRQVLTAAHCVWDVDSKTFVDMLSFAPGRFRGTGGKMVNPYGVFNWSHATLMKNYLTSDETQGDIAVVQLSAAVPKATGTLGLKTNCVDDNNLKLTTAGYPSDQPEGECMYTTCSVKFDCNKESTRHKCDTYMGQSGSSFWDDQYYVRGVHVRGLIDEQANEFTTVSRKVMAKIKEWEGRESGGVL